MKTERERIEISNEVTVKFSIVGTNKKGETLATQIVDIENENEEFRKHLISDTQSCELWIFSKTVGQMDDIRKGVNYSEFLKEIKMLQFSVPKETAKIKLPDKEKILDKIIKEVSSVMEEEHYPFKVIVHVLGAKDYWVFSSNQKPILTKNPY